MTDEASPVGAGRATVHVWCTADQAELVGAVRGALGPGEFKVCGVDGTQTASLAAALGVDGLDDPRELGRVASSAAAQPMTNAQRAVIWLAADADLPPAAVRAIRAADAVILSALPPSGADLPWGAVEAPCTLRAALGRVDLESRLREFGAVHAVHLELGADAALGGVGMALLDGVDACCALLEPADAVAASLTDADGRPARASGLRCLAGTACAHLRDRLGRGATILATDRSPASRRAAIVGGQGELVLEHGRLRWLDRRGREIDRCDDPLTSDLASAGAVGELAAALSRAASGQPRLAGPPAFRSADDMALRLAICDAIRLSALTGATESTSSLLAAVTAPGSPRSDRGPR